MLVVLAIAVPGRICGQDAIQTAQGSTSQNQDSRDTNAEPEKTNAVNWLNQYFYQIGTAGLLAGNTAGLRFGGLTIPGISVTGVVDRFDGTATTPGLDYTATVIQTNVVYDHAIGRNNRIALQYQPSVAFAGGRFIRDFSNQNTSLDLVLFTRPRWSVRLNDGFQYRYGQQAVGYLYLDFNPSTSATVLNTFLDSQARWLSNSAYVSIAYALSARSSISVTPDYTLSESGRGAGLERAVSYGGAINWSYRLTEKQNVGVTYTPQFIRETGGVPSENMFQTLAGTWARRVSGSWTLQGALGVTTAMSSAAGSTRDWYIYGSFGTIKQINPASSIAVTYSRGDTLYAGLVSTLYADRLDASYVHRLGRRLTWSVGAGYFHEVIRDASFAWYGNTHAQYILAPRAGLVSTFDYVHKHQQLGATSTNLFTGNGDLFTFGLRWQPSLIQY